MEEESEENGSRRRRYSSEEQGLAIKLYEESGLSVEGFCEREGIGVRNFERWLAARRNGEGNFVEVEAGAQAPRSERIYRLVFAGGCWLEVGGGFDEGEVRVLAGIVREVGRC